MLRSDFLRSKSLLRDEKNKKRKKLKEKHEVLSTSLAIKPNSKKKIKSALNVSKKGIKNSLIQKRIKIKKLKDHSKNISNLFSNSLNNDDYNKLKKSINKNLAPNFESGYDNIKETDFKKVKKNNKLEGSLINFKKMGKKRKHSESEEESSQISKIDNTARKKFLLTNPSKNSETSNNKGSKKEVPTKNKTSSMVAKKKSKIQPCKDKPNSDSDEEIRNELQSSSVFKNIQKLIKENPLLFSGVCDNDPGVKEESESLKNLSDCGSLENSSDTESDKLSEKYMNHMSSDSNEEESDLLTKGVLISKIQNKEKVSQTSGKHLNKESNGKSKPPLISLTKSDFTEKGRGKVPSEKKLNDFERFQQSSKVNKEEEKKNPQIIVTSPVEFNRSKKERLISQESKTNPRATITSSLRNKALEKLQGAKFRYLNEKMYTESGKESFKYFQTNEDEYLDYHQGYNLQVTKWPINPVNKIIDSIQKMSKKLIIADMGCGDAKIAQTLSKCTVHSFDLVALNEHVTPCNMSKVPLSNESVDVVVFCLSLMGTNLKEYIQEAYRISKFGGILKIAEVESRIPDLGKFIKNILYLGFSLVKKDVDTKLFVFLEFKKDKKRKQGAKVKDLSLKPCLYKKR